MDLPGNTETPPSRVPSLKSLLTIWVVNLGLMILLAGLVAYVFSRRQESSVRGQIQDQAFRRVEALRDRLVEEATAHDLATIDEIAEKADWLDRIIANEVSSDDVFAYMAIVAPGGETVVQRRAGFTQVSPADTQEPATQPAGEQAQSQTTAAQRFKGGVTHHVVPIIVGNAKVGSIQVGLSQATMRRRVIESRRPLLEVEVVLGLACVAVLVTSGISVARLIRRMKTLQEGMAHRERLTAIGSISRRIVHEIRNPLHTMRVHAAVIRRKIAKSDPESLQVATQQLESLEEEIARIEGFAKSFLEAGQLPASDPEVMAPAELIREIAEFVRPEFKEISARVVVETPEGADDLRVRMDPARLKRAILNIIKNAREAMSNGGQLTLVSRRSSRRELQIDIRDTGHGIPNDELPGIFDIQYSKKTEGSGLGLAIVRQIIEEAGGSIRVRSEQGKGTTFAIRLPLCND